MTDQSSNHSRPTPHDNLPPSCRCVLLALRYRGPELSRQALLEETGLPEPTLNVALDRCESRDILSRARKPGDIRQTTVTLIDN
jgi:DNA-binding MarR family transcriptional regulator